MSKHEITLTLCCVEIKKGRRAKPFFDVSINYHEVPDNAVSDFETLMKETNETFNLLDGPAVSDEPKGFNVDMKLIDNGETRFGIALRNCPYRTMMAIEQVALDALQALANWGFDCAQEHGLKPLDKSLLVHLKHIVVKGMS